ncbi:MAG: Spy/CpxP family protein refolding chaperone [Sphingobacteriales bacterium]|nr:Spy/CpxP family protein refolding chaperone [Sphingobacteriales bacterium]
MKSTNYRILSVAVILLLISNIALVFFLMKDKDGREGKRGKEDPSGIMAKELGMTDQQVKDHKQLKDAHFKTIRPLYDSLRAAKAAYFALIKDTTVSDSTAAVYRERISTRQNEIDSMTFAHFKRVRRLFTPEQQPRFDEFVQKMMQRNRRDSAGKNKTD